MANTIRIVEYEGKTLGVRSIDLSTDDNVVFASPIVEYKFYRSTGKVVQVRWSSKRIRLVNPEVKTVPLTREVAKAMMYRYPPKAADLPRLGPVDPYTARLVEKACPDSFPVRCVRIAAELGLNYSEATAEERATIEALAFEE